MIKESYVSFETARLLKEKGFPQHITSYTYFVGDDKKRGCVVGEFIGHPSIETDIHLIDAPTQQMAMAWLREHKNIDIDIHTDCGMLGYKRYTPCKPKPKPELLDDKDEWNDRWVQKTIYLRYEDDKCLIPACKDFSSYEDAVEGALKYCLTKLL